MDLTFFVMALVSPALYGRGSGVPSLAGLIFGVPVMLILVIWVINGVKNQRFKGISIGKRLAFTAGAGIWVAMIAGLFFGG